jgi:hypothetical protein
MRFKHFGAETFCWYLQHLGLKLIMPLGLLFFLLRIKSFQNIPHAICTTCAGCCQTNQATTAAKNPITRKQQTEIKMPKPQEQRRIGKHPNPSNIANYNATGTVPAELHLPFCEPVKGQIKGNRLSRRPGTVDVFFLTPPRSHVKNAGVSFIFHVWKPFKDLRFVHVLIASEKVGSVC